jgi:small subunit ribosomal protein S14
VARKAVVQRELRRIQICASKRSVREELKAQIQELRKDPGKNWDKLQKLTLKFQALPRDTSPIRLRRRCRITGRSRGVYRKVGLARSMFRIHAMHGDIPGLIKASW